MTPRVSPAVCGRVERVELIADTTGGLGDVFEGVAEIWRGRGPRYDRGAVKKLLVVALVAVVVLTGLPVVMTRMAAMASCPACDGVAAAGLISCLAVLTAIGLFMVAAVRRFRLGSQLLPRLLLKTTVDRPPRLA